MLTLDVLKAQEVLVRYGDQFQRNFDFDDVLYDVRRYVLSDAECADILSHASDEERCDKLMFVLSTATHRLGDFINAIEEKYEWLAQRMRLALRDVSKDGELELMREQIEELRNHIPRLEARNVQRKKYIYAIQKHLKNLKAGECLMLNGDLVYGKKWLAIDACSNYEIMEHMGSEIYLVKLDKCHTEEDVYDLLVRLYRMLNTTEVGNLPPVYDDSITNKIYVLKRMLAEELRRRHPDALLILCDVLSPLALKAFQLPVKCMLTTRNKAILDEWPAHQRRDLAIKRGFTMAESLALFARVLGKKERDLPEEAKKIHERCHGNPFIVSLVASNLKEYKMTERRWRNWENMLDKNVVTRDEKFRILIKQSLIELSEEYENLFNTLAIFGDDVKIPLSLLEAYWNKSEEDVEQIVQKFDRMYLVETVTLPATRSALEVKSFGRSCTPDTIANDIQTYCLLKYHYCSYLSQGLSLETKRSMHCRLIRSYDIPYNIADFASADVLQRFDDRYFYFYIGHHLRQAGWLDVFARLFLNLTFLEQKIRTTGLPNTIGDLHTYREYIINKSPARRALLHDVLDFLPYVEEMLKKSPETTLLQYALNASGALQTEAQRQVDDLPHRVFFTGADHINRHRRQIVALPHRPAFIRFCGPNTALIAFENHHIYLADLSPGYTVQPSLFVGHLAAVIDIQLLGSSEFVSLDASGVCHVWSLQSTPIHRRRSSSVRHHSSGSSYATSSATAADGDTTDSAAASGNGGCSSNGNARNTGIRQTRADSFDKHAQRHTYEQTITVRPSPAMDRLRCMAVVRTDAAVDSCGNGNNGRLNHQHHHNNNNAMATPTILMFGTEHGKLLPYSWSGGEWELLSSGLDQMTDLRSSLGDVRAIRSVASQKLLVLATNGALWLYDTKTTSARSLGNNVDTRNDGNVVAGEAIALHTLSEQSYAAALRPRTTNGYDYEAIIVFADRVQRVSIQTTTTASQNKSSNNSQNIAVQSIYGAQSTEGNRITCSVLSEDRRYLVLGTERGIVVLDVRRSSASDEPIAPVLRGRVSDRIACVDLYSLDGERYKYLLMCGTEAALATAGEQLSYLYALESDGRGALMQWAQLDPWLLGGRLFGVIGAAATDVDDDFKLVALDSKGVLQLRSAEDEFSATTRIICEPSSSSSVAGTTALSVASPNESAAKVLTLSCCSIDGGASDYVVIGCADGTVADNRRTIVMRLRDGPVTFLQCLRNEENDDDEDSDRSGRDVVVVAGTPHSYRISAVPVEMHSSPLRQCFRLHDRWLIIVKETATFQVFDLQQLEFVPYISEAPGPTGGRTKCGGCDLVDDCLIIATADELNVWQFAENDNDGNVDSTPGSMGLSIHRRGDLQTCLGRAPNAGSPAVCVKLSAGREFAAVGFQSGSIQLYRMAAHRMQFIQALCAHRTAVRTLLFAPWRTDTGAQPLVLASVAAELCFWNVSHADNNRANETATTLRQSGRFKDRPSPVTPCDEAVLSIGDGTGEETGQAAWAGKVGDPRRPELLACIKFIGREAEQLYANAAFTTFLTVDDSGEIYHYRFRDATSTIASDSSDDDDDDHNAASAATVESLTIQSSPSSSSLEDDVIEAATTTATTRTGIPVQLQLSPLNGHYI